MIKFVLYCGDEFRYKSNQMNGTTVQNPCQFTFLALHSQRDAIVINFQPDSTLSQLTLYSYHDLYHVMQRNPQKDKILLCQQRNINKIKSEWISFVEERNNQKLKLHQQLLLDRTKAKQDTQIIQNGLHKNLQALMKKITEKVQQKICTSKFEASVQEIKAEKQKYQSLLEGRKQQSNGKSTKKQKVEIKKIQKLIEELQEKRRKLERVYRVDEQNRAEKVREHSEE